jgi:Domain of unknown function (DUF4129)
MTTPDVTSQDQAPRGRSRLDWRTELLVLALALAEASAVWLVVDLVLAATAGEGGRAPAIAIFAVVYLGTALPRWLEAFDVWDPAYGLAIAGAIAGTTLLLIKTGSFPQVGWANPEWLRQTARALAVRSNEARLSVWGLVAASAYAWWRGKTRAEPGPDAALALLRIGTVVVLAAAVGESSVRGGAQARATSAGVLVFFAGALAAVAIARLRPDGTRGETVLGPRWLGSMLAPVLTVAAVAVVAAGILSRDLLDTILWFLAPLVWALSVVFRLVILALALIAFVVVSPILWFLSTHPIRIGDVRINPVRVDPGEAARRTVERSAEVPDPIRYLVAAAVLLLIFTGVTRLVFRRRRRSAEDAAEERASVLGAQDLLALLAAILSPLLPRRSKPAVDPLAGLRGDPRWAHTVAIRETYARLLLWSRERGVPREAGTTANEHAAALAPRLGGERARSDLAAITARYNEARYGAAPATAADAATVRDAWRRLRGGRGSAHPGAEG